VHHLSHDEAFLKVRVNASGSLRSFACFLNLKKKNKKSIGMNNQYANLNCPSFHFISSSSKEVNQLQSLEAGDNDFVKGTMR